MLRKMITKGVVVIGVTMATREVRGRVQQQDPDQLPRHHHGVVEPDEGRPAVR